MAAGEVEIGESLAGLLYSANSIRVGVSGAGVAGGCVAWPRPRRQRSGHGCSSAAPGPRPRAADTPRERGRSPGGFGLASPEQVSAPPACAAHHRPRGVCGIRSARTDMVTALPHHRVRRVLLAGRTRIRPNGHPAARRPKLEETLRCVLDSCMAKCRSCSWANASPRRFRGHGAASHRGHFRAPSDADGSAGVLSRQNIGDMEHL